MVYNASVSLKSPVELNLFDFVKDFKLNSDFTSKRYITKELGEIKAYYDPAHVIPDGAMCSYELCKQKDNKRHKTRCSTPLRKYLIFSKKGIEIHKPAIVKYFRDNEVPQGDRFGILNEDIPLGFNEVFPLRVKNESSLENMVSLILQGISVNVSSDSSIHILHGQDDIDPEKVYTAIFKNVNPRDIKVVYTVKRAVYSFGQDIKIVALNKILQRNIRLQDYKYSDKFRRISFTVTKKQNMTFIINSTGKVQIILSPPKTNGKVIPGKFKLKMENAIDYIKDAIDIPDIMYPKIDSDTNVRSISAIKRKNVKPQVCNGNNKMVPIPYAFAGKCERLQYAPSDEGVHYSKAKKENIKKIDQYGPCCYKVTGKNGNNVSFNETSLPVSFVPAKITSDQFIKKCTGKRRIFVYRIVNGFTPRGTDNKAANYIPGTRIIEKRGYKGLLSMLTGQKNNTIKEIIRMYVKLGDPTKRSSARRW
jgi:hypothetical protein